MYLPSPHRAVWHLGPFPLRAYALCIMLGVLAAVWLTQRRWVTRGGTASQVQDVALWAVPFGIVGARLYHVITDPELYFSPGRQPLRALAVWDGGLGIPGAVALGAVGAWIACRRQGIELNRFADAAAPGIVLAQAIGRWGNYFNQELYGGPTRLPWALYIDPQHRPAGMADIALYHPTFLYESLWDLLAMMLLLWLDRRYELRRGRLFACYVLAYSTGRIWIEKLRIDHANHFLGIRINDYVSAGLIIVATSFLLLSRNTPRTESHTTPPALQANSESTATEPVGRPEGDSAAGQRR